MTRGVPKDLATKAQEQFDKQRAKVDRMLNKRQGLMDQVRAINEELEDEITLMQYYSEHPMVKHPEDDGIKVKEWQDQELPLEVSK